MKNIKILALTALILLSTSNGVSATSQKQETSNFLDKANQYNIFAEEDISLVDSDVEGAVAGGKNVFVNQSFIASSKSSDDLISLISGKNMEVKNSDVFNGNVVYGGILGAWTSLRPPGFYMHASILEFGTTFDKIKEESVRVASLSLNTKPVIQSINKLQIYAEHSGFNITEVSGEVLSNVDLLELHIPQGSSLVVNVTGEQLELGTEMILDGDPSSLLFNFYQAHKITLENNVINGTILAPIADLQVDNSEIHGTLISKSLSGLVYLKFLPFTSVIPDNVVPLPDIDSDKGDFLIITGFGRYLSKFYAVANITEWINLSQLFISDYSHVREQW